MSLRANIDHLARAHGIIAAFVESPSGPRVVRGDEAWGPSLDAAFTLLQKTGEWSIRVVVGNRTILMQKEGEETAGVVMPTGHSVSKSVRRMIRRMARKARDPILARGDLASAENSISVMDTKDAEDM